MRVVFWGSSKYVIPILEVLRKNFDLTLIVTTEKLPTEAVPSYCINYKIPYLSVSNLSDKKVRSQLLEVRSQLAVLANFGLIIPLEVLKIFPRGMINLHPSLLPKYRGPTPGQTAILNGDKTTGVTIIKLDEEVDHGPILAQVEEKILPEDTAESLYERLFKIGAQILPQTINQYIKGKTKISPQNHSKATFTKRLTRQDGYFEINNPPSPDVLERIIRAYYPWPGAWSKLKVESGKLKIIKFLPERRIQVEGGEPMSYKDFVNGYPAIARGDYKFFEDFVRSTSKRLSG